MSDSRAPVGVALAGHTLPLAARLRLARRADALGFALILVDGDSSIAAAGNGLYTYDPTALASAVALETQQARLASIHVPHFWNALLLARSLATLQELAGGRLVSHFGVGEARATARLGLPQPSASERVARLDDTLGVVRALLAGETVTHKSPWLELGGVRITPPAQPTPIAVSAAGPHALALVRRHADVWDANVPPLRERLEPARERLGHALPTWIWVFARPGATREATLADYRRYAPWFSDLSPDQQARAVLFGEGERCRDRLEELRAELGVTLPIADLSGLDEPAAERALALLAPASVGGIS
ncbi:MAG TPA: LLM class flavin-dependent oxidoreductase [Myxococcota bacterium]|nr:LLM class flavin-dependent oxidoreductase [Myxococcota bacterium]